MSRVFQLGSVVVLLACVGCDGGAGAKVAPEATPVPSETKKDELMKQYSGGKAAPSPDAGKLN